MITGGHLLSTSSYRELGLSNPVPPPAQIRSRCLIHTHHHRTHASFAATALSDFVTDAAGFIDAHDVARVLLELRSRCFVSGAARDDFAHGAIAVEAIWMAGDLSILPGNTDLMVIVLSSAL